MKSLQDAVSVTSYPGRGIVIGCSADGASAVVVYFIMGRSINSRNRIFVEEVDGIRTEAFDPAKLTDPSLVIYAPVRVMDNHTIVTNGDQTDTICEHLWAGGSFESALRTRTFEPDAPNYTPRISGMVTLADGTFTYKLSLLKRVEGHPTACLRCFFENDTPLPGIAHFGHTYMGDGEPLPSYVGDPTIVAITGDIDATTDAIWSSLNEENKVALFVRYINVATGEWDTRIVNKLS